MHAHSGGCGRPVPSKPLSWHIAMTFATAGLWLIIGPIVGLRNSMYYEY